VGIVTTPKEWPDAAKANEKWIEISIENQTLTLWEGKKPIYATLISTGQDGLDDWKTTKSTIRGTFRIRTKHVTTTMDSTGKGAEGGENGGSMTETAVGAKDDDKGAKKSEGAFELRDVPWVQYFYDGFALHAAYWHDVFGVARSHGCVNLSPIDAHRVFAWTDPPVPSSWHGVTAKTDVNPGTTVWIHK
jgi:lipoprotein-anchoring transpeptidase ErfK/SrfK